MNSTVCPIPGHGLPVPQVLPKPFQELTRKEVTGRLTDKESYCRICNIGMEV